MIVLLHLQFICVFCWLFIHSCHQMEICILIIFSSELCPFFPPTLSYWDKKNLFLRYKFNDCRFFHVFLWPHGVANIKVFLLRKWESSLRWCEHDCSLFFLSIEAKLIAAFTGELIWRMPTLARSLLPYSSVYWRTDMENANPS